MRKTKIICTIGPASQNLETLRAMCKAGMNVARMNFSHGDHAEQVNKMNLVKQVRDEMKLPIAILLDTKGPEYRIRTFKDEKVVVEEGATFTFTTDEIEGDETIVSVNYKGLADDLRVGDRILVCNGLLVFEVRAIEGSNVICTTIVGGEMSNRKSMCFPNKVMSGPYLSEQDKADILCGIENGVDFIAASFVSTPKDMRELKEFLHENGGDEIDVIAKIENRAGVDNVEEIAELCEGIMIARGDLGVEIPFIEVPSIQKQIIHKCHKMGKRVITATEMLESMIKNPRPTRAEISDVANAVYDGSSAVMLSGESAQGKYPVEAVTVMADVCRFTEEHTSYKKRFRNFDFAACNNLDAISHATCAMAIDVDAKAIAVNSVSGRTARLVSRFHGPVDIIGLTTQPTVWRKLNLDWGVTPVMSEEFKSMDVMFYNAMHEAKKCFSLRKGDTVVLTGGDMSGKLGNTSTIKVETI